MRRATRLEKEEALFFLLEQVLQEYAAPFKEEDISRPDDRIQNLCTYMAVSYTHLDVYKRQGVNLPGKCKYIHP